MENEVPLDVLQMVLTRVDEIDIESTHETGSIERRIEEHSSSLFPQIVHTERPDKLVSM